MTQGEFQRCPIEQRYYLLKEDGAFIASRFHTEFNVHLFSIYDFHVEIWQRISLNDVVWIEIVDPQNVLPLYAPGIDLKKDLGLDL
jgi:hypothetical protein